MQAQSTKRWTFCIANTRTERSEGISEITFSFFSKSYNFATRNVQHSQMADKPRNWYTALVFSTLTCTLHTSDSFHPSIFD